MPPMFDLTTEGWIPCIGKDGKPVSPLGLLELLERANELTEIHGDSPLVEVALYRLLLAVLHTNFQNTQTKLWDKLWRDKAFDAQVLRDYFAEWQGKKHRFYVYHPRHPFYQSPTALVAAKDGVEKPKSIAELVHDVASGDNATLFSHNVHHECLDEGNFDLTVPEAIRVVIAAQAYKLPGTSGHLDFTARMTSFRAAPLVKGITFLAKGDTLFETLMLNLLEIVDRDPFPQETDDCPCWERDDPFEPKRTWPRGYMDYLTWQHCKILLGRPRATERGLRVSQTRLSIGLSLEAENQKRDPMTAFHVGQGGTLSPIGWNAERALWRDSTALFHVKRLRQIRPLEANKDKLPPRIFEFLANLIEYGNIDTTHQQRLSKLRCMAFGILSDNANVDFYRREEMPLPPAYFINPVVLSSLDTVLHDAEEMSGRLGDAAGEVTEYLLETKGGSRGGADIVNRKKAMSSQMRARYWPYLEEPFLRIMQELQSVDVAVALSEWRKTLYGIARQSFEKVVDGLGVTARVHKARVRGLTVLDKKRQVVKTANGGIMGEKKRSYEERFERCQEFVDYLERLRDSESGRAAMATLRRGVGKSPDEAPEMYRYLAKWTASDDPRFAWTRRTRFLIASLFAVYPEKPTGEGNLGVHLAQLCLEHDFSAKAIERRMARLLSARTEDLPRHLTQIVRLLESKQVPINWTQLMADVLSWRSRNGAQRVKGDWSFAFWSQVPDQDNLG